MNLKSEDIQRLAGALEEMIRQSNTRLAASRLENLQKKILPEEFGSIQQDQAKHCPQLTALRFALSCYHRPGLREVFGKGQQDAPGGGQDFPKTLTLGHPKGLLKLPGLCRLHTLHLEVSWQDGVTSSRAYLAEQTLDDKLGRNNEN